MLTLIIIAYIAETVLQAVWMRRVERQLQALREQVKL